MELGKSHGELDGMGGIVSPAGSETAPVADVNVNACMRCPVMGPLPRNEWHLKSGTVMAVACVCVCVGFGVTEYRPFRFGRTTVLCTR
jgi:hypothetical protein